MTRNWYHAFRHFRWALLLKLSCLDLACSDMHSQSLLHDELKKTRMEKTKGERMTLKFENHVRFETVLGGLYCHFDPTMKKLHLHHKSVEWTHAPVPPTFRGDKNCQKPKGSSSIEFSKSTLSPRNELLCDGRQCDNPPPPPKPKANENPTPVMWVGV
jgi:hypothetical protein